MNEKTHELLADAYYGLAVCKWANGQDDKRELEKAILHADWALFFNAADKNAACIKKAAEKRLHG